ncbi:MAG: hypothetical protein WBE29_15525, partial [Pseudolabrys sp.]
NKLPTISATVSAWLRKVTGIDKNGSYWEYKTSREPRTKTGLGEKCRGGLACHLPRLFEGTEVTTAYPAPKKYGR